MLIARAARSVTAATGRFARVAEQAAALPSKAAAGSPPPATAANRLPMDDAPSQSKGNPKTRFVAEEKDLESDEALWALYERWCKAFNQERDHDEMVLRFQKFKDIVLLVHRTNNANLSYKLAINRFSDGKLMEKIRNPDRRDAEISMKAGNSWVLVKPGDRFLRQVFAEFKVVNGKLFVIYRKGSKAIKGRSVLEKLNVEYEVLDGRLFVDLPEGHELVVPDEDFFFNSTQFR